MATTRIEELIRNFQAMDTSMRLEMLLDYSEKLPPLPDRYRDAAQRDAHRVHECMTPVSLWVDVIDDRVRIYADAPRESPTVRGFISLLIDGFHNATPDDVASAPDDMLNQSGLVQSLGMNRMQGLSAIYRRIKSDVATAGSR